MDQLSGLQHLEAATTYRGDACSTAEAMSLYMIVYARNARTCNCARTCIIQGIHFKSWKNPYSRNPNPTNNLEFRSTATVAVVEQQAKNESLDICGRERHEINPPARVIHNCAIVWPCRDSTLQPCVASSTWSNHK